MSEVVQGNLTGKGRSFGIVVSRFNEFVTKELLAGALDGLARHEVADRDIQIVWVPGSFEIPLVAKTIAKKFDAVICLGAVIRGSTPHFDYVAGEVTKGIALASMETGVPIVFGVVTTENIEQAIERAGTKMGNKGFHAALTALEMADLMRRLRKVN